MPSSWLGQALRCSTLGWLLLSAPPLTWAQVSAPIALFKVITVKDEIIIGLNADELSRLDGRDAGAVARALANKGAMTVWKYAVRKGANGDLQEAPLQKIGLLANSSLRVEPYSTPHSIIPHE